MNISFMKISKSCFSLKFLIGFLLLFIVSCSEVKSKRNQENNSLVRDHVVERIKEKATSEILVCAHRGYHKYAPENSLEAVKKAIEAGIDIVEVDVNTTKDGILILMHDDSIDRTTNGNGYVSDFNYQELKEFYLKIEDSVTTHKIPTLNEVLDLAEDKIILNLDIKQVDVARLYQQLRSRGMEHMVFSFMWDREKIDEMLSIDSLYAVLPLVSSAEDMVYYAQNIPSKFQHFDEHSFNSENMIWAKNHDILVLMNSLWEVDDDFVQNQLEEMNEIIELRPTIIQTDHPKILIDYLDDQKLHN